jgi:GntR family transcriptional regulator, transcriptional repressor for pyruvate dehydrogenase complex
VFRAHRCVRPSRNCKSAASGGAGGAGIYVANMLGSAFSPSLIDLFSRHQEAVFDYISFRRDMEGMAAERAARFGSDTDLKVIDTVFRKMEAAHQKRDPADEAELDAEFHLAIIEASHNIVMLHMMRAMFDLLRAGVFYNRQQMFKQRTTRDMLLDQHRAINLAIQTSARCRRRARAAEQHMSFVEQTSPICARPKSMKRLRACATRPS